jgi:putative DNA primase/helicase
VERSNLGDHERHVTSILLDKDGQSRPARPAAPLWQVIPDDLKFFPTPQWVMWHWALNRDGRWTKPPFQRNGDLADSSDPRTWTTFDAVLATYLESGTLFDGVGFEFGNTPFCGWDFDHCLHGDVIDPDFLPFIRQLDSYVEISPSGTGVHVLALASLAKLEGRKRGFPTPEEPKRAIECYDSGRFFTVTGNRL